MAKCEAIGLPTYSAPKSNRSAGGRRRSDSPVFVLGMSLSGSGQLFCPRQRLLHQFLGPRHDFVDRHVRRVEHHGIVRGNQR